MRSIREESEERLKAERQTFQSKISAAEREISVITQELASANQQKEAARDLESPRGSRSG